MATSVIKKAASDTLETGTFSGKGFTLTCYRVGRIVSANLYSNSATSQISAGTTILTVGERFRPKGQQIFLSANVGTSTDIARVSLAENGTLKTITGLTSTIVSGGYLRFSITYIALNE